MHLVDAARYRHPVDGALGRMVERLVAGRTWLQSRRRISSRIPMPQLASDVEDVAYLNWWVDPRRLPTPPLGYRYWGASDWTLFTILTYRHGHFGPLSAGPLRRCFPSPQQSNWRWYLVPEDGDDSVQPTVLFARNVIDSLPYAVGARLFSDAMQPHLPAAFEHGWCDGVLHTRITPGRGSAPSLTATLTTGGEDSGEWWSGRFDGRRQALRFLACQDEAIAIAPDGRLALTRISLPIELDAISPLSLQPADLHCPLLLSMGGDPGAAFCFHVPKVEFRVVSERLL